MHKRSKVLAALGGPLLGAAVLSTTSPADATIKWSRGGLSATADRAPGGQTVTEVVTIGCTEGGRLDLHLTLNQRAAHGGGFESVSCPADIADVAVVIGADEGRFRPGDATVWALVVNRDGDGAIEETAARCADIRIEP